MAKQVVMKQYPGGDLTTDGIVGSITKATLYGPPNTQFKLYSANDIYNTITLSYSGKFEIDLTGIGTLIKISPVALITTETPIIIQAIVEN